MSVDTVIWLFFALFTKHFICDFLLQGPFQYLNKGTYGHPGGVFHSAIQAAGTILSFFLVLGFTLPAYIAPIAAVEYLVHYHIDWAKMNINAHFGLKPDNSEKFWYLLGFDQYLHYLTYVGIVLWAVHQ